MSATAVNATLIRGDCAEVLPEVRPASIDMVLADPPYGITARNSWDVPIDMEALWPALLEACKDDAAIVLFSSGRFTASLMTRSPKGLWRYNMVWHKTEPTGFLNANRMPLRAHEDICVFYRRTPYYRPQKTGGHVRKASSAASKGKCARSTDYGDYTATSYDSTQRHPTSVLTYPGDKQKAWGGLHPTQKPQALCEFLVRSYCPPGGTVLDFCMGSGTTGAACALAGRDFVGIESDGGYFEVAAERLRRMGADVRCERRERRWRA